MTLRATEDTTALVPAGAVFRRVLVRTDQFVPEHWVGEDGGPVPGAVELSDVELAVIQDPPAAAKWQIDTSGEWAAGPEPPGPTAAITGWSPSEGTVSGGTVVTVQGTGLTGTTGVLFGDVPGVLGEVTDTSVAVTSPAQAPAALPQLVLQHPDGDVTFGYGWKVYPVSTGAVPNTGLAAGGEAVVINGEGLTGATAVLFGNGGGVLGEVTDTTIACTTPAGAAGAVNVTVEHPVGGVIVPGGFTYAAAARGGKKR